MYMYKGSIDARDSQAEVTGGVKPLVRHLRELCLACRRDQHSLIGVARQLTDWHKGGAVIIRFLHLFRQP